jgi:hypothetical protein
LQGGIASAGQWLAAAAASLAAADAASAPATALALLMLSIGVDAVPMLDEALMSGALADASGVAVVTSSFLLQPPRAT